LAAGGVLSEFCRFLFLGFGFRICFASSFRNIVQDACNSSRPRWQKNGGHKSKQAHFFACHLFASDLVLAARFGFREAISKPTAKSTKIAKKRGNKGFLCDL
jgi:hypothetical protein